MFLWCCQVYAEYCETNTKREGRHSGINVGGLVTMSSVCFGSRGFLCVGVVLVRKTFCRLHVPRGAIYLYRLPDCYRVDVLLLESCFWGCFLNLGVFQVDSSVYLYTQTFSTVH